MHARRITSPGTTGGIVLIVLGLIFFLITQGGFNLNWGNSWPLFLILAGALALAPLITGAERPLRSASAASGTLLLLLGLFFLATTLGMINWDDQGTLWPLYPIIVGLALLAGYATATDGGRAYLLPGLLVGGVGLLMLAGTLTGLIWRLDWPAIGDAFSGLGWLATWWPLALLLVGLLVLAAAESSDRGTVRQALVAWGTAILLLGGFFLLTTLEFISWGDQGRLWPLYIIILGVALLAGRMVRQRDQ